MDKKLPYVANASTHLKAALSSMETTVDRVLPKPGMPTIVGEITTGLQRGTSFERTASVLSIGASSENDIVLLDDGIADRHAVLSFERSLIGTVASIKACDDDVICNGHVVSAGTVREAVRLPITVTTGGTVITFGLPHTDDAEVVYEEPSRFRSFARSVLLLGVVAFSLQAGLFLMNGFAAPTSFRVAQHDPIATVIPVSARPPAEDLLKTIREDFEVAGLNNHLVVSELPNGGLEVSGNLPTELKPQWDGLRMWYDRAGLSAQIISSVREASLSPVLPALAAVRLSEPAELILMNGLRLRAGDTVTNDWSIAEIAPEGVSLVREGQAVLVPYE